MTARFADRIARAQKAMAKDGYDVLVVTNRENLIYFTGVTQIECLGVLIPEKRKPAPSHSGSMPITLESILVYRRGRTISRGRVSVQLWPRVSKHSAFMRLA